jgi:cellulose synthase/poly-beta-1,6-N-acetylglucosamine synthase-like glycosyltransferase
VDPPLRNPLPEISQKVGTVPLSIAFWMIVLATALFVYAYLGYPLLVGVWAALRPRRPVPPAMKQWPRISITVPAYNEEREIAATLESLLRLDYPADRREVIVVSDASTDRTDEIVQAFSDRGVKLIRMERRTGKTAAENAAAVHLSGEIVVNTDASIRIGVNSLKPLIAAFADPTVGLASGRDISVSRSGDSDNAGESGYVGYEMMIRSLETRVSGIIGASGCFYAIRSQLHRTLLPDGLSRDFAAALISREHGYRAVSVEEAICYVPRTASLRAEYRRKVRTMTRGMETLFAMRRLLNPLRYGAFAWMLFSHKVCRWLVPWATVLALVALLILAPTQPAAAWLAGAGAAGVLLGLIAFLVPVHWKLPRLLNLPAYLLMGNAAALHASLRASRGGRNAMWEPTRREVRAA